MLPKDSIFYDADEIVGSRIMASGRRFFLVKWAAKYGPEAKNSWEPEDNLTAMLIEEWEDKVSHRYVRVPGGNNSGWFNWLIQILAPLRRVWCTTWEANYSGKWDLACPCSRWVDPHQGSWLWTSTCQQRFACNTPSAHARCSLSLSRQSCRLLERIVSGLKLKLTFSEFDSILAPFTGPSWSERRNKTGMRQVFCYSFSESALFLSILFSPFFCVCNQHTSFLSICRVWIAILRLSWSLVLSRSLTTTTQPARCAAKSILFEVRPAVLFSACEFNTTQRLLFLCLCVFVFVFLPTVYWFRRTYSPRQQCPHGLQRCASRESWYSNTTLLVSVQSDDMVGRLLRCCEPHRERSNLLVI